MDDHKSNFFNKITESATRLTPTENAIAEHLMSTYPNCMLKTSYELAREIDVNVSTVTRFFQKIGYKSIRTAQSEFKKAIDLQASSALSKLEEEYQSDAKKSLIGAYAVNEVTNIEQTFNNVTTDSLDILTGILSDRKNSVTIISDLSGIHSVAYYLHSRLKAVRPNINLLKSDHAEIAKTIATTKTNDLLIVFDFKKYSKLNNTVAKAFKGKGGRLVLFTDSPLSPIVNSSDIHFETKTASPSSFDSYVSAMALVNLIIDMISKNWEDFMNGQMNAIEEAYGELDF